MSSDSSYLKLTVQPGFGSKELHLGQNESSARKLFGKPASIRRYATEGQYFYNYPKYGVELDFGKKGGQLKYIYFFREGVHNNQQIDIVTESGIHLADTKAKIRRRLGKPDSAGGGVFYGEWMTYNTGITFEFGSDLKADMIMIHRAMRIRKMGIPVRRSGKK